MLTGKSDNANNYLQTKKQVNIYSLSGLCRHSGIPERSRAMKAKRLYIYLL